MLLRYVKTADCLIFVTLHLRFGVAVSQRHVREDVGSVCEKTPIMRATTSELVLCNHREVTNISQQRSSPVRRTTSFKFYSMVAVEVEEQETDELRDFREIWNKEVQERKRQQQQDSADPSTAAPKQTSTSESGAPERFGVSRLRDDALGVYTRAVKHEQADELDEALRLYRQAFRMDSNVDKVYHLREERAGRTFETTSLTATPPVQHKGKEAVISVRSGSDAVAPRVAQTKPPSAHHLDRQISGLLAGIVAGFPRALSFEPEDERAWSPLQRLPDELLVHILSHLGVAAIERFARVSRKARMITLDATIWRSGFSLPFFPYAQRRSFAPNLFP